MPDRRKEVYDEISKVEKTLQTLKNELHEIDMTNMRKCVGNCYIVDDCYCKAVDVYNAYAVYCIQVYIDVASDENSAYVEIDNHYIVNPNANNVTQISLEEFTKQYKKAVKILEKQLTDGAVYT